MFDEKTQQHLKSYVYALFSDTDSYPFYIGKGNNNRIFDHMKCAIKDDESTLKYDKIRSSKTLRHLIIRHGLSDNEAYILEGSLIDIFYYIKEPITNIAGGHNCIEKGIMTTDEIIRLYSAERLNELQPNSVIININSTYKRGNDKDAIYKATKEVWAANKKYITKINYVLSDYRGFIVEVFEVLEWYEKDRPYGKDTRKYGQTRIGYGFNGIVAHDDIRNLYINKSIKEYKNKGARNSIRYTLERKGK